MAFVIEKNGFFKIALNEDQKNDLNFNDTPTTHTISDTDFNEVIKDKLIISISDGVVTTAANEQGLFETEEELKKKHETLKTALKNFLDNNSSSKNLYSTAQTYYNTLNSFDYSTITFPLTKSWEEYCNDNSIEYLHYLQIP